jgi:acyl-coenzyme A thioesterase PaaI-like protein
VCSPSNAAGLAVHFNMASDGSVTALYCGLPEVEGYPGLLHGGVIAALLDGAMTNCLFAHGTVALTVELNVRYRATVSCCEECKISATLEQTTHRIRCGGITFKIGFFRARVSADAGTEDDRLCKVTGISTVS